MNKIDYSVIVPVYNSEATLEELFKRTKAVFDKIGKTFEVIFVEDCGQDNSWEVIEKLKLEFSDLIVGIKLSKNFGQHNAIFCGLNHVSGQFIVTIDDDLQIPPEEILKLIDTYNEARPDLVYGSFKKKQHSVVRNIGSRMIKNSAKNIHNTPGEGSSFKLFVRVLAEKLIQHHQEFVYIDELLLWYTSDIAFVEVEHLKRKHSKSGYTPSKLLMLSFNLMIYYTAIPLKFMTYIGFISSIFSFIVGIIFIIKKIFYNVPIGFTSIIVTVLFSGGLILMSLGIIGEYLSRIYKVQNKKPPYSIKKIL